MQTNTPFTPLKILKHSATLESVIKGGIPVPITVEIDPTNLCNFECGWCMYGQFNQECPESLSQDFLLSLINDLADMGVKSIVYSGGGEPLMNKATPMAMSEANEKGVDVALVTNGELLKGEIIKTAIDNCSWIRISLDASTAETYHRCHGIKNRNAFQTSVQNIDDLVKYRNEKGAETAIGLGFLVHPSNYQEVYGACKLAKELGVDYIQFRPVYAYGFDLDEIIVRNCKAQIQQATDEFQSEDFLIYASMERFKATERQYKKCLACNVVGAIAADMQMYVCCQLKGDRNYKIGDLTNASFKEVWEDPNTHARCAEIDVSRCPPCRYDGCNRILNYLSLPDPIHVSFI